MSNGKPQRRNWTTSEVKRLEELAGRAPVAEICEELGRSEPSVRSKAADLRANGMRISLKHYESPLVWCPSCATWRTKVFKRTGECLVCRLEERVDRAKRRCDEALDGLSDEARAEFLSKQFIKGSSIPPRPALKHAESLSAYERAKRDAEHAVLVERWEAARLRKMANAEKTRLSRIRRKARDSRASESAQTVTPGEES